MIARHYRGWTTRENADAYEALLRDKVLPALRGIAGYRGGYILRADDGPESEFVVVNFFDSLDAVRAFAGDDYRTPVFEPEARALLARIETVAHHYEVRADTTPNPMFGSVLRVRCLDRMEQPSTTSGRTFSTRASSMWEPSTLLSFGPLKVFLHPAQRKTPAAVSVGPELLRVGLATRAIDTAACCSHQCSRLFSFCSLEFTFALNADS